MQKTEHSTRDHLLDIGEELSLKLGFTGMGLSKLLHQAGVPKGSFYHYFQSKEAFGVALLRRYNDKSNAHLTAHFTRRDRNMRDLILEWYSLQRKNFTPLNPCGECLTVKLSAEVCDLSDEMRATLQDGAAQLITILSEALIRGVQMRCFTLPDTPYALAHVFHALWLGACLQTKIFRNSKALDEAISHVARMLPSPIA
ncbi:TetR/AcrR family transcriptional regulator [Erwinia sp. HR93]|uniref:TetR/AcrR family transcriptional regulator n=1 Tax=Erwinia sp. HR93 TaxID=3094840 RepID=UPI003A0FDD39